MIKDTDAAYRSAAASGATHIGLLLLVYDALAGDMKKAQEACIRGDVAGRCRASNHAFDLFAHLESWTAHLDDRTLAASLNEFYATLRSLLIQAQGTTRPQDFEALAEMICSTRAVWQAKENSMRAEVAQQRASSLATTGENRSEISSSRSAWSA